MKPGIVAIFVTISILMLLIIPLDLPIKLLSVAITLVFGLLFLDDEQNAVAPPALMPAKKADAIIVTNLKKQARDKQEKAEKQFEKEKAAAAEAAVVPPVDTKLSEEGATLGGIEKMPKDTKEIALAIDESVTNRQQQFGLALGTAAAVGLYAMSGLDPSQAASIALPAALAAQIAYENNYTTSSMAGAAVTLGAMGLGANYALMDDSPQMDIHQMGAGFS